MNVIVIQLDSLNRHFLPAYGGWVKTPNIDAFAERAVIFDAHYTGSLPCMPARREIWAGVEEFWWRGWGPLEPWDEPVAYLANRAGVTTALVTDHYHFFEWGAHSYHHDFDGYEFVRGHEHDNWRTQPLRDVPDWATKMIERHGEGGRIYLRNVEGFQSEADFFGPKVMSAAAKWLGANRAHDRFYLHVDSFDVHEPFHVPEPYRSMYTDDDPAKFNPWPPYGRTNDEERPISPEEVAWVRAQFAGKLTMVDAWLGRVFDVLTTHDLWKDTCVILSTDHGHYLGEHQRIGKPMSPLWNTLTHIPLMIWHPGQRRRRVSALTQTVDLYATVLDVLGIEHRSAHSRSVLPLVLGETDAGRDLAVYGYANQRVGVTDGSWTLLRDHDPQAAPASWYSLQVGHLDTRSSGARRKRPTEFPRLQAGHFIPGVSTPHWKMPADAYDVTHLGPPRPDLLYHTALDPQQDRDLTAVQSEERRRLKDRLRGHMRALGVPEEQFARLRL